MAQKPKKLNMSEMEKDFYSDTSMIGIVCPLPAYHFCWKLNDWFEINFECDPSLTLPYYENEITSYFSVFEYTLPNSGHTYLLYKVKNDDKTLIEGLKKNNWLNKIDYLWLLKTGEPKNDADKILKILNTLPFIRLSRIIENGQLNNLENFMV